MTLPFDHPSSTARRVEHDVLNITEKNKKENYHFYFYFISVFPGPQNLGTIQFPIYVLQKISICQCPSKAKCPQCPEFFRFKDTSAI